MIISRTPMRVSFLGGGSDLPAYYENDTGYVVSAAIKKHIYITVSKPFDNIIKLHYSKNEIVNSVEELQHDLAKTILKKYYIRNKIEIGSISDFPAGGTGMGSSSSYCVGLINAMHRHRFGLDMSPEQLSESACDIEIKQLKKPIGKQDQFIAAFGGIKNFTFSNDDSVLVGSYELSSEFIKSLESHLILLYTGVTRSADSILAIQSENTKNKSTTKSVVSQVVCLAKEFDKNLKSGNHNQLGVLLDKSWQLKTKYANNVSTDSLDYIYKTTKNFGAQGGKLLGAGGGGFFLLYADPDGQLNLKENMPEFAFFDVKFDLSGSKIIYDSNRETIL